MTSLPINGRLTASQQVSGFCGLFVLASQLVIACRSSDIASYLHVTTRCHLLAVNKPRSPITFM